MFKYVLSAFICLAFAMPAAAQCGCNAAPSCRTPKKLGLIPNKICLPKISMKCTTDSCGCSRRKLSLGTTQVDSVRLGLVDKGPCDGGFLKGLLSGGCNKGCGCAAPAPAPCGCSGGGGGGIIESAPTYAEPTSYAEPMSYGDSMSYGDPVAAPVADCGCNG